jgi:ABC-type transport system involved in multi-copper enzyme maturation permease subunit
MNQILWLTAYEIRLYLRSKTFWLIGALIVVAIFIPLFELLLIQFMVIGIVTRDESSGFSGIIASLPHHTSQLYLARALAAFCLLLGFWPFIVLTVGFLPGMQLAEWLCSGQNLVFLTLK